MQRFERLLFNFINYLRHIAIEVISSIRHNSGKGEGYGSKVNVLNLRSGFRQISRRACSSGPRILLNRMGYREVWRIRWTLAFQHPHTDIQGIREKVRWQI